MSAVGPDPVTVIADAIRREQDVASPETLAQIALTALHEEGWRIVRVHPETEPLPVAEEWRP